jgi:serine/threonine-protein kinase
MKIGEWEKVKAIFNSAVELEPEDRAAYLDDACAADDVLREEVEKLLDSYRSQFMEAPDGDNNNNKLAPGTALGRYEIVNLLGVGGMGEVYLAKDGQLDRKVAIKILNKKYESNEANVRRFEQEAKAASALNHPNILTIHEIGEQDGAHYIVSEFVDGHRLRTVLEKESLELPRILSIVVQIAEALSAAHAARIVHRDIKPENIVIRNDGYAKVLDFGLAKLLPEHTSLIGLEDATLKQNQTAKGLILGTVSYMSPEQAKGEAVDARTDIFSLGVLLYEMVTGRTPFTASSTSETLANLISRDPDPMSRYEASVPGELERIVNKMLRKNPDERYQTMKGLLADIRELKDRITLEKKLSRTSAANDRAETVILNQVTDGDGKRSAGGERSVSWWKLLTIAGAIAIFTGVFVWYLRPAATLSEPQIKSLAVLPLKSLDAGENYLGLGIADAVIRRISQTGQLAVRPTSAIRKYLSEDTDAITAARQLSTDAVLEGSVQRSNDRLRISVNLLRTSDGVSIWSDNFDMRSADIFTVQDSVAQQVASKLRLQLDPEQKARMNKHATSNQMAYDYYLKGVYSFDQRTWGEKAKPQAQATADLFKSAIAADPNFALAHAQLANVYSYIAILIDPKDPAWAERAQEAIARAESLDPTLAETHIARGTLLIGSRSGYQWEAGIREFLAAQQIDPNVAHVNLGDAYYHIGLEDLADREFQRGLEIDPTSKTAQTEYVLFFLNLRRYEEFDTFNQKYFPDDPPASDSFVASGRLDEAEKLMDEEMKNYPDNPWNYAERGIFLGLKGDRVGAEAAIRDAIKMLDRDNLTYHHMTYEIACAYSVLGETGEAMKWLRETADTGFPCYPAFQRDVFFNRIRQDPRFVEFMAEMKSLNEKYRAEFQ